MSVNDMRANRYNRGILGELTAEDYATACGELLAGKRYKKEELIDKGFTDAELASKAKPRAKVDRSKCGGLKNVYDSRFARGGRAQRQDFQRVARRCGTPRQRGNDVVMVGDLLFKNRRHSRR